MASILLNLIDRSNDSNNSSVVIFGKDVTTSTDEIAIAWQVIKNLGQGFTHPFTYDLGVSAAASDSYGNYSPRIPANVGSAFGMTLGTSGDVFAQKGEAANPTTVEVANDLPKGAINAQIYRSGKLFATKSNLAPGQKAVFEFKPTIWIGVASEIEEGDVMNAAILSTINTEISLLGIASADIVMTGGGPGPNSTPFAFNLENIKMV